MRNSNFIRTTGAITFALAIIAGIVFPLRAQTPASGATIDQILKDISSFDGGIDSAPFWKLRAYVSARRDVPAARVECETKLLEFLATKATPVAKMAVCRQLRLIGSEKSVPVLQAMLLDKESADMALYALQKIPGAAVNKALLQTLSKAEGATKTEIIAALGERRCTEAVPALAPLLKPDGEFAGASALAMGEIGGEAAVSALIASYAAAKADRKHLFAASLMKCAEGLVAAKNDRAAAPVYDKLSADTALPAPLREAAMIGKITVAGDQAAAILFEHLQGSDPHMQEAAISKIKDVIKPEAVGPVCSLLPSLPESAQVKVLAVLTGYPKDRVLPAILKAAESSVVAVRLAALKALETAGDASTVAFLAETAAKTRGAEQSAARGALGLLKGRPVDDTVLALLAKKPADEVQVELLQTIAERRMFTAKKAVAESLASPSSRVRPQALRSMRIIGTPSDIPAVIELLLKSADDAEWGEAEATIAALAQKIANPDGRSNAVKQRLGTEKDPQARARLFRVLSRIGDDSALPLLRTALNEQNEEIVEAAVRALAGWPTPAVRDDIFQLVQKSKNEAHRLLALQGFVRLTGLERYRKPEAVVGDLRQVSLLASRPEEMKLILGILPRFACPEALELAGSFLGDPFLKAEAQAAANKIKAQISKK